MRGFGIIVILTLATALLGPRTVEAQLSPGDLSGPHRNLEGSDNCLECHSARRGVDPRLCLSCHELLAQRISAGLGLHSREEYTSCERCHIEHNGREFELVWWGEKGILSFDHSETGNPLEGPHVEAECRDCHRASSFSDPRRLRVADKHLGRTFLGLSSACISCHSDQHEKDFEGAHLRLECAACHDRRRARGLQETLLTTDPASVPPAQKTCDACHEDAHAGQFGHEPCDSCHNGEEWAPASRFDHARSRFALTGAHLRFACDACHSPPTDSRSQAIFRNLSSTCSGCHQDVHEGRLGSSCEQCHSTDAWRSDLSRDFDHDQARFRLEGLHRPLECSDCHASGSLEIPGFDRCSTCHADEHEGQFEHRDDGGECAACHDVDGFLPPGFGIDDHAFTAFPLGGAHRAIPCVSCHTQEDVSRLLTSSRSYASRRSARFLFADSTCYGCHLDPHDLPTDLDGQRAGDVCTDCHSEESWKTVSFDHSSTAFELRGLHLEVSCTGCHTDTPTELPGPSFRESARDCIDCHRDNHAGQFQPACDECHSERAWAPALFDHDEDSRFELDGLHRLLECGACHLPATVNSVQAVLYRPLPLQCEGCHAGPEPQE